MLSNRCKNISENMYRLQKIISWNYQINPWHILSDASFLSRLQPLSLASSVLCMLVSTDSPLSLTWCWPLHLQCCCLHLLHPYDTVEDWKEEQQEMVRRCWWACTVDSDLRTNRRSARRVERMGRPARRTGRPRNAQTPQPCTADEQELTWSGTSPPRWCPQLLATCPSNSTSRSCNGDGAKRRIFGLEKWKTMKWCHQCADGEGRREKNGGILSDDDISSVW